MEQEAVGNERDIRPLFREKDVSGGAGRALSQLGGRRLAGLKEEVMEFLAEFELNVPEGTPESDVKQRESAEAASRPV